MNLEAEKSASFHVKMVLMIIGLLLFLGLALGSFVNAFVWRMHEQDEVKSKKKLDKKYLDKLSIQKGRSMCPHCKHELAAKDLVPVLSWLYLKGKCRYCHKPIEDSPLVELSTMAVFGLSYAWWPYDLHGIGLYYFVLWLIFLVAFMVLAVYDLRWYILPDKIVFPIIFLAVIELIGSIVFYKQGWHAIISALWGVLVSSGLFYAIFVISKEQWIGGGDVKLGVVIGIILGGPAMSLLMLFIASSLGSIVGIPFLVTGKRNVRLPFGPFLLMATVVVMLFGGSLIHWYRNRTGIY